MHDVDVAVVGAGLAGLSAARTLVAAGRTVASFSKPETGSPGAPSEGSSATACRWRWAASGSARPRTSVLELIDELGLKTFPSFDDGEALTVFDGNVVRYADETFGLPPESAVEVGRLWEQVEVMAAAVTGGAPWERKEPMIWTGRPSTPGWSRTPQDSIARSFFRLLVPALFSAESPELSLLHFLFYVHSGTSLETLVATTGGAQETRVVGGTHQISRTDGRGRWAKSVRLEPWSGPSARTRPGVAVEFEGGSVHGPAGGRRRSADAGGPDTLHPGASRTARRAHPADAGRLGDQVPGRLRHSVLARRPD